MEKLVYVLLLTALLTVVLVGCHGGGGGGGDPPPNPTPTATPTPTPTRGLTTYPGGMKGMNYYCQASTLAWGGGFSASSQAKCIGLVQTPLGDVVSPNSPNFGIQSGFLSLLNALPK